MFYGKMLSKYRPFLVLIAVSFIIVGYLVSSNTLRKLPKTANSIPRVKFSIGGNSISELNNPLAVAIDSNGRIYVSDSGNNQVKVFSSGGKLDLAFGKAGTGDGQFNTPYGIGILSDGSLLVCDMLNYRIQRFDKNGKFLSIFLSRDYGIKPGNLMIHNKDVYVSDLASHQIVVFDQEGHVQRQYIGGMNFPQGMVILKDKLLVADAGNNVLKSFSEIGKDSGDVFGKGITFKLLRGVAVDNLNRILVVDSMDSQVQFLAADGEKLFVIGGTGKQQDQLMYPAGITIDKNGNIYIADWGNNRIQVWGY